MAPMSLRLKLHLPERVLRPGHLPTAAHGPSQAPWQGLHNLS